MIFFLIFIFLKYTTDACLVFFDSNFFRHFLTETRTGAGVFSDPLKIRCRQGYIVQNPINSSIAMNIISHSFYFQGLNRLYFNAWPILVHTYALFALLYLTLID